MNAYKIEKGIPLPRAGYPWKEMRIGNSFLVPDRTTSQMAAAANAAAKRLGFGFTCRAVSGGTRVWRIK